MWFLLILASAQIAIGQEVSQQNIIRTSPIVIPGCGCGCSGARYVVEDPRTSDLSSQDEGDGECCGCGAESVPGSQFVQEAGCGCGCSGARYAVEDPRTCDLSAQDKGDGECSCCACGADNGESESEEGSPSFSVAMLAPLASVLTSFMSGLGRSQNEAVTFDFGGQTCSNPFETPPQHPQCPASYVNPVDNQSLTLNNVPLASPIPQPILAAPQRTMEGQPQPIMGQPQPIMGQPQPIMGQPQPIMGQPQPIMGQLQPIMGQPQPTPVETHQTPQRVLPAKHRLYGPHCFKRPRKGYSDIEEDSLYAFAQKKPKNIHNPKVNQETAFNLAFPRIKHLMDNKQEQTCANDLKKDGLQKDSGLIQFLPSGNPNFDTVSRLAMSTSHQNHPYVPVSNIEQSFIPMT